MKPLRTKAEYAADLLAAKTAFANSIRPIVDDIHSSRTHRPHGHFGHALHGEWCHGCNRDTAHKGMECLLCGGVAARDPSPSGVRINKGRYGRLLKGMRGDKYRAFSAAAEASRRKFEGDKT